MTTTSTLTALRRRVARDLLTTSGARRNAAEAVGAARLRRAEHGEAAAALRQAGAGSAAGSAARDGVRVVA